MVIPDCPLLQLPSQNKLRLYCYFYSSLEKKGLPMVIPDCPLLQLPSQNKLRLYCYFYLITYENKFSTHLNKNPNAEMHWEGD